MIDFRYHVVSIVAVFIALAVGIVLGAGPLKEDIGSTLTAQVTQLRADKDALREQLKESQQGVSARDEYAELVTPGVVRGRLTDQKVSLVVLPDADADLVKRSANSLRTAGATVIDTVAVKDAWVDEDKASGRTETVTTLAPRVGVDPNLTSAPELAALVFSRAVFGQAASPGDRGVEARAQERDRVLEGLQEAGLIQRDPAEQGIPTSVVVVAGPLPEDQDERQPRVASFLRLLGALGEGARPTVLVSGHQPGQSVTMSNGVVAAVRSDPTLTSVVSTVDDGNLAMGQGTLVLALHGEYDGDNGHYGLSEDAAAVAPELSEDS